MYVSVNHKAYTEEIIIAELRALTARYREVDPALGAIVRFVLSAYLMKAHRALLQSMVPFMDELFSKEEV